MPYFGGTLTATLPHHPATSHSRYFDGRLFFWPRSICDHFRIAPASSRLGRRLDQKQDWFAALRTLACQLKVDQTFVWVKGTACAEATVSAAALFGCSHLEIVLPNTNAVRAAELEQWIAECCDSANHFDQVFVSPVITDSAGWPLDQDELLIAVSERVVVLECRKGGKLLACLEKERPFNEGRIWVLQTKQPKTETVHRQLIHQGAVPWILHDEQRLTSSVTSPKPRAVLPDGPLQSPDRWLCHWTRPTKGEWPDQSREDFLTELLLNCHSADRSALATLLRILRQQKLVATVSRSEQARTVSWTEVPLIDFRKQRQYRRHRQRFDFEPWGIAARKQVLREFGVRKVQYVDNDASQDGLTQPRFDRREKIDWSVEREWRSLGDFQFHQLASDDVCVFVNAESDAQAVANVCPYHVVVVPSGSED